MTATADERREVAERLRSAGSFYRDKDMYGAVFGRCPVDGMLISERKRMFERLAGLIDPTCHEVVVDNGHAWATCSACGVILWSDDWVRLSYCPACGARVLKEGE